MKSIAVVLFVFGVGCVHTGVKRWKDKENMKMSSADINLDDYIGTWKLKKEIYGCFPIKIEKGPEKGTVKITRKPLKLKGGPQSINTISVNSHFNTLPKTKTYKYPEYKLSTSALFKFIRGKIVSAVIWAPDTNDWLGVGLRALLLDKGVLILKKAGLTMQDKSNDPREKAVPVFNLDGDDVILKWQVECKYIKSP